MNLHRSAQSSSRSRRIQARLITTGVGVVLGVLGQFSPLLLLGAAATGRTGLVVVSAVLLLALLAASVGALVLMLVKAQTIGYRALGMVAIDTETGQRSGGKLFLRSLLQGLIGVPTLGIGDLIVSYVTYVDGRTWFDRTVGVTVVDIATLTAPTPTDPTWRQPIRAELPGATVPRSAQATVPVVTPHAPIQEVPAGSWKQPPNATAAPDAGPMLSVPPAAPTPAPEAPALVPRSADGQGLITSTPFASPAAAPRNPIAPTPIPVPPSVPPPPVADRTVIVDAQQNQDTRLIRFDDGTEHTVRPALVMGRNPTVPRAHPGAVPVTLSDPEMRISKTHLVLQDTGSGLTVVDLQSTNGVRLLAPGGPVQRIPVGQEIPLPSGVRVYLGTRWFEAVT